MYSRKAIAGAAAVALLLPVFALAETDVSAETQAKIQSIRSQIQELQKQLMVLIGTSGTFRPIGGDATNGIVSGKVTSVDSSSFVVQNKEGSKSVTVNVVASTTIQVFSTTTPHWREGSMSDIVVGRTVGVQGAQIDSSTVEAKLIKVGVVLAFGTEVKNSNPGQTGKALCIALKRNLGPGSRGDDVRSIQEMLAADPETGFNATPTGIWPSTNSLTSRAMMMWQKKQGITPADDGSAGPLTRGLLMRHCGKGLDNSGPGSWNSGPGNWKTNRQEPPPPPASDTDDVDDDADNDENDQDDDSSDNSGSNSGDISDDTSGTSGNSE